jgi:hypothetical protein
MFQLHHPTPVCKELSSENSEPTPIFSIALLSHAPVSVSSAAAPLANTGGNLTSFLNAEVIYPGVRDFVKNDFSRQFPFENKQSRHFQLRNIYFSLTQNSV